MLRDLILLGVILIIYPLFEKLIIQLHHGFRVD